MIYIPRKTQIDALRFALKNPANGLFMRMGAGKTVIVLTLIDLLMYEAAKIRRVLLLAPIRVAMITWPDEIAKWQHTRHLSYNFLHGAGKERAAMAAHHADITAVNYEGLQWIYKHRDLMPRFDMLVVDESTFLKNPTGIRTTIAHGISRFIPRKIIMTGSPSPNSLEDLWSQMFILDRGKRLEPNITTYRKNYFIPNAHRHGHSPMVGSKKKIVDKIRDIVIVVGDEDLKDMPPVVNNKIKIRLPSRLRKQYDKLESEFHTVLDCGHDIEALNQQAKTQKLRQFISGFVYDKDEENNYKVVEIHKEKLKALKELITSLSSNVLIAIQFREEAHQIRKYLGGDIPFINSESKTADDFVNIKRWQRGDLPELIAHPGSIGHGLNLQTGGSEIIWFSQTWSLDHWEQYIARLARPGQKAKRVMNHILIMENSIDEPIYQAINRKAATQKSLMKQLKDWRSK